MAWTYNSVDCGTGISRSLIRFAELNTLIPPTAMITSVTLNLYGLPSSGNPGNTGYPASPHATDNQMIISRVTSAWNENTVTWNSAPTTTTQNQITTPASTTRWNWNYSNNSQNLRDMVQIMVSNPTQNFGFQLQLQTEATRRAMMFASADHPTATLRPELIVTYIPCYAHFTIATSSLSNGIYTFNSPINDPAATHQWYYYGPNGYGPLGTSSSANTTFNQAGTYKVCHQLYLPTTKCEACIEICTNGLVGDGQSIPPPGNTAAMAMVTPEKSGKLVAAPNPTDKNWTVNFVSETEGMGQAVVVDIMSRKVLDKRVTIQKGTNTLLIEGGNLAPGQYILNMQTNEGTWSAKLVKY